MHCGITCTEVTLVAKETLSNISLLFKRKSKEPCALQNTTVNVEKTYPSTTNNRESARDDTSK